ncbi:hypothetical protein ABT173_45560 [Streptomyces sp. NPDC001795]|uniref:hypothetical protein n=1 Tax=unclassified Streptomyces TaxID=2593676 RepID=UPI0033188B70
MRNSIVFGNAAHGITDDDSPVALTLTRGTTFRHRGTGFDMDISGGQATHRRALSVTDGRAVALGSAPFPAATPGTWRHL